MYVVGVTKRNCNPAGVFQFIYRLIDVFKAYFGGSFGEESIRSNFVLVYELLDGGVRRPRRHGRALTAAAFVQKRWIMAIRRSCRR
jgi:hypothetical protein